MFNRYIFLKTWERNSKSNITIRYNPKKKKRISRNYYTNSAKKKTTLIILRPIRIFPSPNVTLLENARTEAYYGKVSRRKKVICARNAGKNC